LIDKGLNFWILFNEFNLGVGKGRHGLLLSS
jgi:hypothetical protein